MRHLISGATPRKVGYSGSVGVCLLLLVAMPTVIFVWDSVGFVRKRRRCLMVIPISYGRNEVIQSSGSGDGLRA